MKRNVNTNLLSLGVYYFVLARSAVFFGFNPNSGNLYHLALELLLKSVLSKKYPMEKGDGSLTGTVLVIFKIFRVFDLSYFVILLPILKNYEFRG